MSSQHSHLLQTFRKVIPPLLFDTHKGQSGRIGIVGGSEEYTGAPIFASMAAFRTGADLVHVFCTKNAAIPIKSFSPDLIVHPILDLSSFTDEMNKVLPRLHAMVIGPGLGRDKTVLSNVEKLIDVLRKQENPLPLVVDADGLFLITEKPDLIKAYENCILTPNGIEFERLYEKITGITAEDQRKDKNPKKMAQRLADELKVNIFLKGHLDTICSHTNPDAIQCGIDGSPRRCGGQGDLLAGALVTCYQWTLKNRDKIELSIPSTADKSPKLTSRESSTFHPDSAQVAGYAASTLIRTSCQAVFSKLGRSMISVDVLKEIGPSFSRLFEK